MRAYVDARMAVTDLPKLSERLKALRGELARKRGTKVQQWAVAQELGIPPRTFQSWENGEVETEGRNYDLIADFYTRELSREITRNWILYGQDKAPPIAEPPDADVDENAALLRRIEGELAEIRAGVDQLLKRIAAGEEVAELATEELRAAEAAAAELDDERDQSAPPSGEKHERRAS